MTPERFRKIALGLPGVVESSHMNHPDFRYGGKIFATLGAPDPEWGMIKFSPAQQRAFCEADSATFEPCKGAWGKSGCTFVRLASARAGVIREAMSLAIAHLQESATEKKKSKPSSPRRRGPSR